MLRCAQRNESGAEKRSITSKATHIITFCQLIAKIFFFCINVFS